ncbi:hypothetical protein J22TS1_22540 [Siminovitchia terrae]|nr:hypothetical protein J22TS1_22540 [Siminovitchia terrae]
MTQSDAVLTLPAGLPQLHSAICDEINFEGIINEQLVLGQRSLSLVSGCPVETPTDQYPV